MTWPFRRPSVRTLLLQLTKEIRDMSQIVEDVKADVDTKVRHAATEALVGTGLHVVVRFDRVLFICEDRDAYWICVAHHDDWTRIVSRQDISAAAVHATHEPDVAIVTEVSRACSEARRDIAARALAIAKAVAPRPSGVSSTYGKANEDK